MSLGPIHSIPIIDTTWQVVFAIDPGPWQSAYAVLVAGKPSSFGTLPNGDMLERIDPNALLVIEQIKCYGMPVGDEILRTVFWSGRFAQEQIRSGGRVSMLPRKTIVAHLCGSGRAKDSNVRQRLIDIYGEKGTKKNPGQLYGIKADEWSALAVATAAHEIGLDKLEREA